MPSISLSILDLKETYDSDRPIYFECVHVKYVNLCITYMERKKYPEQMILWRTNGNNFMRKHCYYLVSIGGDGHVKRVLHYKVLRPSHTTMYSTNV